MASNAPRLKDLVTILYRPRETMRRVLDCRQRWTIEVLLLACILFNASDKDVNALGTLLPDLGLGSWLALVVLSIAVGCVIWVLLLYLFSWMVDVAGRWLGGSGSLADVRAALAWGCVPLIWAVIYKVPVAIYSHRFTGLAESEGMPAVVEFVKMGGCTLAVLTLTLQLAMFIWMLFIASSTVAEAMRMSTPQGLGALAIAGAAPVVIGIAAALALSS